MLIEKIKAMLAALEQQFTDPTYRRPMNQPTPQKRARRIAPHNHGKGESKVRRKMAARSNQINRKRVKRWKF